MSWVLFWQVTVWMILGALLLAFVISAGKGSK